MPGEVIVSVPAVWVKVWNFTPKIRERDIRTQHRLAMNESNGKEYEDEDISPDVQ